MAIVTMDQRKERRVCIKCCASLGKSATESLTMIQQAFGDQTFLPVEKTYVTKAKKCQTGEKQCQEYDHHFL
jgi:hypothetical protein